MQGKIPLESIKNVPKDGGSRTDLARKFQLGCHKRFPDGFKDVYGRMAWEEVSPTITGGCISPSKGRFLHPSQNRSITLREAALLQTFPKDYYFSLKRGRFAVALMIGNALPPTFIKTHALAVKESLYVSSR
jgi:DNA (cytosine-5)-methyltransferase 1